MPAAVGERLAEVPGARAHHARHARSRATAATVSVPRPLKLRTGLIVSILSVTAHPRASAERRARQRGRVEERRIDLARPRRGPDRAGAARNTLNASSVSITARVSGWSRNSRTQPSLSVRSASVVAVSQRRQPSTRMCDSWAIGIAKSVGSLDTPGSARLRIRGADDARPRRIRAVLDEDQGELLGRVGEAGVVEVEHAEPAVSRAPDVVGPEVAVTGSESRAAGRRGTPPWRPAPDEARRARRRTGRGGHGARRRARPIAPPRPAPSTRDRRRSRRRSRRGGGPRPTARGPPRRGSDPGHGDPPRRGA